MDADTVRNHSGGLRLGFLVFENQMTTQDLHKFELHELQLFVRLTNREDLKTEMTRLMSENSF